MSQSLLKQQQFHNFAVGTTPVGIMFVALLMVVATSPAQLGPASPPSCPTGMMAVAAVTGSGTPGKVFCVTSWHLEVRQ